MIDKLSGFIDATSDALLPAHVGQQLAGLAERLGFTSSLVVDVAALERRAPAPIVFEQSLSSFEAYRRGAPFSDNALGQFAAALDAPFDLQTACVALGYREDDVRASLFPPVRDKHIVVLPVHRQGKLVLFVACAGDKPDDSALARALLHASAHAAYDLIVALSANRVLSDREAACLKLISHGSTYAQTGLALGIAERTVRAAVASAKRKLNARTKTGVIAKAVAALRPAPPAK